MTDSKPASDPGSSSRFVWQFLALFVLLNGLGWASGYFGGSGQTPWYLSLEKPLGQPPGWVFPVVWTTLYSLMALSVALLLKRCREQGQACTRAIQLFCAQFVLNMLYTPLFFGIESPVGGAVITGSLVVTLPFVIRSFWSHSRTAGALLLPYMAWVCYAFYLGISIIVLN